MLSARSRRPGPEGVAPWSADAVAQHGDKDAQDEHGGAEQADVAEELEQRGIAGERRTSLGPEQRQHRPVDQPGDSAGVVLVGQQADPRSQIAAPDDAGDAVQVPGGAPQQQGDGGRTPPGRG